MTEDPGTRGGPAELVIVRHGESVGNLADAAARREGLGRLDLNTRDADTPLSETGEEQARVLGRYLARLDAGSRPEVVLSSPYARAAQTAEIATVGLDHVRLTLDERLRERDLGAFDGLTGEGIRSDFPEEARRRSVMGKFYYRPPGGESWTDVAMRVRQLLGEIRAECDGRRVWLFTHQAVIMSFRLVLEGLDEQRLLEIDRSLPLANCSVTRYRRGPDGSLHLDVFADTEHLDASSTQTTHERPHAATTAAAKAHDRDDG